MLKIDIDQRYFFKDGKLRYANNSNYKNDTMIRKEAYVSNKVPYSDNHV